MKYWKIFNLKTCFKTEAHGKFSYRNFLDMLLFSSELPTINADTNNLLVQQTNDSWIVPPFIHGTYSLYHFCGTCMKYDFNNTPTYPNFRITHSLRLAFSKGPDTVGVSPFMWGWKQIQFPKHCVLWVFEYRTMDKVQKRSNSECYTPSSRIYIPVCFKPVERVKEPEDEI
jgi:hypothetical protein